MCLPPLSMNLNPIDIFPIIILLIYLGLASHRSHFLMVLIFLEATIFIIILSLSILLNSLFLILTLLTFAACEAALGLCCLVKLTSNFGSDIINSISITKC
jgi:hypothetical protein